MSLIFVLFSIFAIQLAIVSSEEKCHKIVSREEWEAKPSKNILRMNNETISVLLIHHTATAGCTTDEECVQSMKDIQQNHMKTKKWFDIGYSFAVGGNGKIYEGRGWGVQSAHTKSFTHKGAVLEIAFIGKFKDSLPTEEALKGFDKFIYCHISQEIISESYIIIGHSQSGSTKCPGKKFFDYIKKMGHYEPKFDKKAKYPLHD